ncbi:MAG: hypothetical protein AUK34_04770 [Ignavibacteria bacterium CG2_30_36_16]|nr:MAG: hypothetical protein AUK34_04770 [Ignavibacteria bacterium CG2_30_36_16]
MKSTIIIFISFFTLLSINISAQKFQINHVPSDGFVIDKVGKEIYYRDFWTGIYYKKNLYSSQIDTINFGYFAPSFANKSHKYVLFETQYLAKLTDLDNDTSYYIFNLDSKKKIQKFLGSGFEYASFIFSPNDSLILFRDPDLETQLLAFKFIDSTFYISPAPTMDHRRLEWSSDSTVIFKDDDYTILECYLYSGRIDTLVKTQYQYIMGYSYNRQQNILAYSYGNDYPHNKMYFYYKNGDSTRIIFDLGIDPVCQENGFTYLKWDDDGNNLSVISDLLTNPGSGIMRYNLKEDNIHEYLRCDDYGRKYYIQWWNADTVIYYDMTQWSIDGFYLDKPLGVKEEKENKSELINSPPYPNPFNSNTVINLDENVSEVEVKVYNILGEMVNKFKVNDNKINWNGKDRFGNEVHSGIYLITYKTENNEEKKTYINKVIYLK